jgi:hypothetical protein
VIRAGRCRRDRDVAGERDSEADAKASAVYGGERRQVEVSDPAEERVEGVGQD